MRAPIAGTWIQGPSALWSLGAQAAELLFDAGQRHALTDQARHNYEAQAAGYRNTVLLAFEDVEDQLSGLRILEQESGVEQKAVASAQHSFDLSNQRYKGGVTSYLEVLTAETDAAPEPAHRHRPCRRGSLWPAWAWSAPWAAAGM